MASKNKQVIQKAPTENKNFSYEKGNVSLKFGLRTDIKAEMADFLDLLKEAIGDVEKDIATRFPKR